MFIPLGKRHVTVSGSIKHSAAARTPIGVNDPSCFRECAFGLSVREGGRRRWLADAVENLDSIKVVVLVKREPVSAIMFVLDMHGYRLPDGRPLRLRPVERRLPRFECFGARYTWPQRMQLKTRPH